MLGAEGVGKSSLCAQFLTSEHINAYGRVGKEINDTSKSTQNVWFCFKINCFSRSFYSSEDNICKEVSVALNKVETRLIFVDHQHGEMSVCGEIAIFHFNSESSGRKTIFKIQS